MSAKMEKYFKEELSDYEQELILSLLPQIRWLMKVCPDDGTAECIKCSHSPNVPCNGTGHLPIEPGDVVVRLK